MRWLREPFWHFVVLGVAVFGLQRLVVPAAPTNRILVTANIQRALVAEHTQRYGAPPTAEQTAALIDRWVDDEVRVHEALALHLDRDDIIVRRRLIQKMDFLLEDTAPLARATDADLNAWLAAHPERYARAPRVALEQVFVATDRHTGDARALATGWRSRLDSGEAPATLGDPFLRGREFPLHTQEELVGIFGAEFAAAVMAIPSGLWSEPLRSSFGWHLVRVTQREAGGAAELAAVRDLVERDWREAQRATLDRDALQKLRARYDVVRDAALP